MQPAPQAGRRRAGACGCRGGQLARPRTCSGRRTRPVCRLLPAAPHVCTRTAPQQGLSYLDRAGRGRARPPHARRIGVDVLRRARRSPLHAALARGAATCVGGGSSGLAAGQGTCALLRRRALTARQAALVVAAVRAMRRARWLPGALMGAGGSCDSSDAGAEGEGERSLAASHPVSLPPSSGWASDAASERPASALGGVPALPPRRASSGSRDGSVPGRCEANTALALLRQLLSKDYAVGYLLLSWLLRTSWALAPALARLLGLATTSDKSELVAARVHGAKGRQLPRCSHHVSVPAAPL